VTLDHGSEFIGQDFCDMCKNDYGIKKKVISIHNLCRRMQSLSARIKLWEFN
jgi:hypothetical protein